MAVNGDAWEKVQAGSFLRLRRVWKAGDHIRLSLCWSPRLVYGAENPEDVRSGKHVAVLYGPLALARDKRLGQEGNPVALGDGTVSVRKADKVCVPCQCCFEVSLGGETFLMVDYASAGKTWRRDSETEVWMRTEERHGFQ